MNTCCKRFAGLLLAVAACATCGSVHAQAAPDHAKRDAQAEHAEAVRAARAPDAQSHRLASVTPEAALDLSTTSAAGRGPAERLEMGPGPVGRRPGRVFGDVMREQVLQSRAVGTHDLIVNHMPEVMEDDNLERQSSRAAEHILGRALGSAVGNAVAWKSSHVTLRSKGTQASVETGFQYSSGPEWVLRRKGLGADIRFSVPMTPGAVKLHAWHEIPSSSAYPRRLGAGIAVDPFEQSITAGVAFQF
jgi:hypothetical protein